MKTEQKKQEVVIFISNERIDHKLSRRRRLQSQHKIENIIS